MTIDASLIDPDERLLWSGKPGPVRYALGEGIGPFVVGAFVLLFAWGWISIGTMTGIHANSSTAIFFWPVAILFLALGAAMLASALWHLYKAFRTTYFLTNKRAIVAVSGIRPHRLSVPLGSINAIDARPYCDDHGSIIFKEEIVKHVGEGGQVVGESIYHEGFIAIPDLAGVERILRRAIDMLSRDHLIKSSS
jgi:hypothetical protein